MEREYLVEKGLVGLVLTVIGLAVAMLAGSFYSGCHTQPNPPFDPISLVEDPASQSNLALAVLDFRHSEFKYQTSPCQNESPARNDISNAFTCGT